MLIPVFPPTEESTCASNVVGTLTKQMPLFKILATNPEKSPTIPPPTANITSLLLKLFLINFQLRNLLLKDFNSSLT